VPKWRFVLAHPLPHKIAGLAVNSALLIFAVTKSGRLKNSHFCGVRFPSNYFAAKTTFILRHFPY
jgi:hypothetical protein